MAFSLVFSSHVLSSCESPCAGHMSCQTLPVGWSTISRNVRYRRCLRVRGMQASAAAEAVISEAGHIESKNLYEVLQISPAATAKDIKRAYRKLARDFHPDKATSPDGKNERTQMFLRIHSAYVTLSDPCDRAQYDRQLLGQKRALAGQTWPGITAPSIGEVACLQKAASSSCWMGRALLKAQTCQRRCRSTPCTALPKLLICMMSLIVQTLLAISRRNSMPSMVLDGSA